jgi:hypothetical protein
MPISKPFLRNSEFRDIDNKVKKRYQNHKCINRLRATRVLEFTEVLKLGKQRLHIRKEANDLRETRVTGREKEIEKETANHLIFLPNSFNTLLPLA